MTNKLDELLDARIDTYSYRLKLAYDKRMERARDKKYAHSRFMEKADFHFDCVEKLRQAYGLMWEELDDSYRLGNPIERAIVRFKKQIKENSYDYLEPLEPYGAGENQKDTGQNRHKTEPEEPETIPVPDYRWQDIEEWNAKFRNMTDLELVYFYADHKAKDIFFDYVIKQGKVLESDSNNKDDLVKTEQNKEFSNYRRTAAIYLMIEQLGADGKADFTQKSVSRFLEFLSGVKEGNLYERVNEIYNNGYKKSHFNDLRYVQKYFSEMQIPEIVQDIDDIIAGNKRTLKNGK